MDIENVYSWLSKVRWWWWCGCGDSGGGDSGGGGVVRGWYGGGGLDSVKYARFMYVYIYI